MQATTHRRFVSSPKAALAITIGLVIAGIVIVASQVLSTAPPQTVASVQSPAQLRSLDGYAHMRFVEENTWQIPYTAPRTLTFDEVTFIESNTFQIPYVAPVLSIRDIRFMEENTLGYHAPAAANGNDAGCSSETIGRTLQACKDY